MLVVPDHDASRSGKRLRVFPAPERGYLDAMDRLVAREKDGGSYWIRNDADHPYISPVIPILLKMAVPVGDALPVLVKIDVDLWRLCMDKWLAEHKRIRREVGKQTGFFVWKRKSDCATATQRCSGAMQIALRLWLLDEWAWNEESINGKESDA